MNETVAAAAGSSPGDLVAQQLVLNLQPGIVQPERRVFLLQLDRLDLKLRQPALRLLRPLQKTRHQSTQRIQRQRVGMFGGGETLCHGRTES